MKIFMNFLLTISNLCVIKKYKWEFMKQNIYFFYEGENVRGKRNYFWKRGNCEDY
jgi:hypothetical protein